MFPRPWQHPLLISLFSCELRESIGFVKRLGARAQPETGLPTGFIRLLFVAPGWFSRGTSRGVTRTKTAVSCGHAARFGVRAWTAVLARVSHRSGARSGYDPRFGNRKAERQPAAPLAAPSPPDPPRGPHPPSASRPPELDPTTTDGRRAGFTRLDRDGGAWRARSAPSAARSSCYWSPWRTRRRLPSPRRSTPASTGEAAASHSAHPRLLTRSGATRGLPSGNSKRGYSRDRVVPQYVVVQAGVSKRRRGGTSCRQQADYRHEKLVQGIRKGRSL